jgi:Ca2+-transporting ATPase
MTFVVMGLGTVFNALTNRRNPASGLTPPILTALAISVVPVVPATEVGFLRRSLLTQELTGYEWLACIGLAGAPDRDRSRQVDPSIVRALPSAIDPTRAVTPARVLTGVSRP